MRPLLQAAIWGLASALFYGLGSYTSYGNSATPDVPDRLTWGAVAFGATLVASTLVAWYVIRRRQSAPIRAWRLGGLASCLAAVIVYVPVFYWITTSSYVWYMRSHPGAADNTLITFVGSLLAMPILFAVNFLVVEALAEGAFWLNRQRGVRSPA